MNSTANIRFSVLKFACCLMLGLGAWLQGTTAFAQQEKTDTGNTGQVAAAESAVVTKADFSKESSPEAALANLSSATFGPLSLTVQVDQSYCASGGVQCLTPGVAALNTNRNPVRLGLQVLRGSTPVTTLTNADISLINPFVPAGGAAVGKLACGNCFQNAGNGLYALFVNPANAAFNWKSGSYFVQVTVQDGPRTYRALAQIEIPF